MAFTLASQTVAAAPRASLRVQRSAPAAAAAAPARALGSRAAAAAPRCAFAGSVVALTAERVQGAGVRQATVCKARGAARRPTPAKMLLRRLPAGRAPRAAARPARRPGHA
jgi:hypothetical protein